jgi:hypothetical protein
MEDSTNNKLNIEDNENDEENEEEIATTYCPYKKVTNFFGGLFNKPENTSSPKLSTNDSEKPKCPFGFTSSKKPKKEPEAEKPKCPFGFTSSKTNKTNNVPKGKCPFGFGSQENKIKNEDEKNASDDDSGDEEVFGGCPVMGKGRKDPQNKDFEQYYEIPCFGNYDFLFFSLEVV